MVPTERSRSEEKMLLAMRFKRSFKKNSSFMVSIRELNEGEDCENSPSQVPPPQIQVVLNEFKDVMPLELSKKFAPQD